MPLEFWSTVQTFMWSLTSERPWVDQNSNGKYMPPPPIIFSACFKCFTRQQVPGSWSLPLTWIKNVIEKKSTESECFIFHRFYDMESNEMYMESNEMELNFTNL